MTTLKPRGQQLSQVFAHVGVVVDDQHSVGRRRAGGHVRPGISPGDDVSGSQPSASSTYPVEDCVPEVSRRRPAEMVRGQVGVPVRQRHGERRALVDDAGDADRSAVQLDELLYECKADAGAFVGSRTCVRHAVEPIEHLAERFGRNPHTRIGDRQFGMVAPGGDADAYFTRQRVLERIRQQVEHDLFPHRRVDVHGRREPLRIRRAA